MYQVLTEYRKLKKVLMHKPGSEIELVTNSTTAAFGYSGMVNAKIFRKDYDTFLKRLIQNDTEPVLITDVLKDDKEVLSYIRRRPNMLYTRDIAVMVGRGAILMNLALKSRKFDEWVVQKTLEKLKIPILGRIEPPGILEGGGVMFFDEHTILVGLCDRANEIAINQLKQTLFTQTPIDRLIMIMPPEGTIHIDGIIMMIDEKLAIVHHPDLEFYPSIIFTKKQSPKPIWFMDFLEANHVELIKIFKEERKHAATNYIATGPREVVGYDFNMRVHKEIQKRGGKVSTLPARELSKGRAGPHCMTCPLWRE